MRVEFLRKIDRRIFSPHESRAEKVKGLILAAAIGAGLAFVLVYGGR